MIKVDSLTVKYKDFCAVDDISFSVGRQEIFGIIGSNGAGKTSTVECMEGLRKPCSGNVSIMGCDPWKDRKQLHEIIGVQLQDTSYQDRARVYEICELFSSLYDNPMPYGRMLEAFGLEDKRKAFVSKLSGGQKQKLAIVLSLISNPKVVFLDELTTGLDPKARHQMWDMILELRERGLTIVIVSHFMDEVEAICDRVAIMNKGRISHMGTVGSIVEQYGLKQKLTFRTTASDISNLKTLDCIASVHQEKDLVTLLGNGNDYVNRVLTYLGDNSIQYTDLSVKKPDLEDVFLDLVGYASESDTSEKRQRRI